MSVTIASREDDHPDVQDLGEGHWSALAQKHWAKPTSTRKIKAEFIKTELWEALEKEEFQFRSLLILESLQLLENYLWPGYSEESTNHHVLLIALLSTVKGREKLPVWDVFSNDSQRFSSLFRRVLSMCLDASLETILRNQLLSFIICAFQSLDNGLVRKECAPLVSISIWHNLASDGVRDTRFEQNGQLKKSWRASTKRYESADDDVRARLRFERSWLYSMLLDFLSRLQVLTEESVRFCEKFLEFLSDLVSQLPTRRYVSTLLNDLNILAVIRLSPIFNREENGLLRDLFLLLRHFMHFPIDDSTGAQLTQVQFFEKHCERLARLQRTALKHFKSKLTILALSNYGAIDQRKELESYLHPLTESELAELCALLGFRTAYPTAANVPVGHDLQLEVLISAHERKKSFLETIRDLSIVPTETTLYEPTLLRNENYNGSRPLAIPKLNLQYLSVGDFLWRAFILYRCESFFEVRKDIEDVIKRLQPRDTGSAAGTKFEGYSKMAIPISKPAIIEVAPPKVGCYGPASVKAEIILETDSLAENVRLEWESLRQDDVIYLCAVQPSHARHELQHRHSSFPDLHESQLRYLRTAEIVQLLDDRGRSLRENVQSQANGYSGRHRLRRMIVNLDGAEYNRDIERKAGGIADPYEAINLVIRRRGRENNFSKVLRTVKSLTLSDIPVSDWLQEVLLGYGDPTSATYSQLANRLKLVDFRDTFLDWQHLVESLPGKTLQQEHGSSTGFGPPYVLGMDISAPRDELRSSKKRRRDDTEPQKQRVDTVRVSTYEPPNYGPYPHDAPKVNKVRFTPLQVEAIISGTQPGLTVIVGPPGTGKTDVATQIVNNIYHDFPEQRTVLIAHSNQALNQLFQKITNLDIDARHLLRLGHGEEELETDTSYGKQGRVESFLDNRVHFLAEVDRLAANFNAPGAHGNSCETAGYFYSVYVRPAWSKFWDVVDRTESSADIILAFPFHRYFHDAPQPLFPQNASRDQIISIAKGCQLHIDKVFSELEDIRPFEILRSSKDKTDYLMIKEARIIAMTSTHAAMRRQEMADLGFRYENIIMEEAAQITEIESFIPLELQNPKNGELPLQRVVLCGDHLQNSPIVQNYAFRQFANLEQSLFLRLVRLGVPTIDLDRQGRARPSIAELYSWRYKKLDSLPNILNDPEFQVANAGFRYDFQFIDVPDYKGQGESQPSPHFIQNLGEAEYAVAIYQYMRLLGYPASKITILTTYAGQRALIKDVLAHRCARNKVFGSPRLVTTVDKYQGEQNDYIIVSLTRTNRVGYLRDIRRLTVALSRARLGLYILGRRAVFETCHELREAFSRLLTDRPDKLMVVTGEMFGATTRLVRDDAQAVEMTGVEHLGLYVYEMTKAKIEGSRGGASSLAITAAPVYTMDGQTDGEEHGDGKEFQPEELDEIE